MQDSAFAFAINVAFASIGGTTNTAHEMSIDLLMESREGGGQWGHDDELRRSAWLLQRP